MPPVSDHGLGHLAKLAKRRRADLGIALTDTTAKAGGLSKHTWQRVEKGLPIRETNYVKVDGLLEWAPGSCLRVIDGGEPVLANGMKEPDAAGVQKSPIPPDVVDDEVRGVVQLALIATAKGTTAEEIRKMSERIVRDLRDQGKLI